MTSPDEVRAQARAQIAADPERAAALARISARAKARPRPPRATTAAQQWADFCNTEIALENERNRKI